MAPRRVWWPVLAWVHRWLGIAGCLLFALWFTSGIAMMYVGMPSVTSDERFARALPIDVRAIQVSPAAAAERAGARLGPGLTVAMLGTRPVYQFGGARPATVFADSGETFAGLSATQAVELAGLAFSRRDGDGPMTYAGRIESPDQWTLQSRAHLPLHRVALNDASGTEVYLSNRTGQVVMDTTRRERAWAYIGPVAHWLYLPVLRRNGPLWTQVIIWSSIAGCVLCVTGLLAGLVRAVPLLRRRAGRQWLTPYAGWMKWHHYAGLLFGVVTLTWTFSGLLSMGPFAWLSGGGATRDERRAVTGEAPMPALTLDELHGAISSASTSALRATADKTALQGRFVAPKEMRLIAFRGHAYWLVADDARSHVIVSATDAEAGVARSFPRAQIEAAARDAAPEGTAVELTWLDDYDAYYYDRTGQRPLPVLRARFSDPESTWLYLDPGSGGIAMIARRPDRANRWLYHGLHSLDVSWLYNRRPLWDVVVITLSLGGLAGVVTSIGPAVRRLQRVAGTLPFRRRSR